MKILDRYIVREVVGPFLFGVGAFTVLFFSVETLMGVARMVVESRAGFGLVMDYLACRLPQVLIFTFPMAILLACLLAFGRISGDSELVALRASGVSFFRIAAPALGFCLLVSLAALWMNDTIVPRRTKRADDILLQTERKDPRQRALLAQPRVLKNGMEEMVYANKLDSDGTTMEGVFIHFFYENQRRREIYAEKAHWNGRVWVLKDMRSVEYNSEQNPIYDVASKTGWTPMQPEDSPPGPKKLSQRKLQPEEMNRAQLRKAIASLPPATSADQRARVRRNRYSVMLYQKLALPWASFVFGAFAIPLGVRPHRSSRSIGLGLSLLFILVYYVLMTTGMILGEAGTLPADLAAWLPNLVFGVMGFLLLLDASRK